MNRGKVGKTSTFEMIRLNPYNGRTEEEIGMHVKINFYVI
jgi:hypothetical protein